MHRPSPFSDQDQPLRRAPGSPEPFAPEERFELYLPLHYESGYRYPLVVWISSGKAGGTGLTSIIPNLSLRNYVAVAPHLADLSPTAPLNSIGCRELARRIDRSIQRAMGRANIHPDRVFLVIDGDWFGSSLHALTHLSHDIRGMANVRLQSQLPCITDWNPPQTEGPELLFCLPEPAVDEHDEVQIAWRLYHTLGFRVRVKTSSAGPKFVDNALRNIDRWIMEQVTGQPSLDPIAPPQPSFCFN